MTDQPISGVHLATIADGLLPVQHSLGTRSAAIGLRARQLQAFLRPLQSTACQALGVSTDVTLLVVNAADWQRICSYPYGLPFTRTGTGGGHARVVVAADYPARLLARFDPVLLTAAQAGQRQPAHLNEFMDLLVGHEWGHAVANLSGLRTRLKWLDEFNATYLFVQALMATGQDAICERLATWASWQVAGSKHDAADLASFEYPRGRAGWSQLLWYQGVFAERAIALAPQRGWDYLRELGAKLPTTNRGQLARRLIEVEPSFKQWFAVFGKASS